MLIERMLHFRGLDTVRITKVKGHADEGMVLDGRVREVDRFGNDAADEAADFGRRRVGNAVIVARRNLSGSVGVGTLFFLIFIDFSLPFLELWSIMMIGMVQHLCSPQEASAGSCGSGQGLFARATWYLGFGLGSCAFFCYLC